MKPDTKGRFQSIAVFNEDHYIQRVIYEPGTYTFTKEDMGTRYIQVTVRTLVDPNDPDDIAEMRKAQDAIQVIQSNPGRFEVPNWDQESLAGLRKAILTMTPWVPDSRRMFGAKEEVGELRHFIGTAGGIFGNAEKDALYLVEVPKNNDGKTPFTLTVKDVPVDGFWSIAVYNAYSTPFGHAFHADSATDSRGIRPGGRSEATLVLGGY